MRKKRTMPLAALILCVAASSALGRYAWYWTLPYNIVPNNDSSSDEYYLTGDNGSHAVAMTKYSTGGSKLWTSILTQKKWHSDQWDPDTEYIGKIQAYEYKDVGSDWRRWDHTGLQWPFVPDPETLYRAVNCHVANNSLYKTLDCPRFAGHFLRRQLLALRTQPG